MAGRFWGLTRRQTVVALGAAVVVGVLVAIALGGNGTTSSPTSNQPGPRRVVAGTRGSPHAVWVFGFDTLRFDRRLGHAQQVAGAKGFGSVLGARGRVYLYEPTSGRVGVLPSARNRLETIGRAPSGAAQDDLFAPGLAVDDGTLWLVSAPGRLTRFGLTDRRADPPLDVGDAGDGDTPVATGVVARSGTVVTATQDDGGIVLARVDPATRTRTTTTRLDLAAPFALDGLATDGTHVWVVAAGTVYALDATDLAVTRTIPLDGHRAGAVRGAVGAAGALWLVADNGATLLRVDTTTGRVTTAMRILAHAPSAFRIPASLVTDGAGVWAMVQKGDDPDDHRVRVVTYDARRGVAGTAVDLPSRLFAGALAAT